MFKFKILIILFLLQSCSKPPISFKKDSFNDLYNFEKQDFNKSYKQFLTDCKLINKNKSVYLHDNKLFGLTSDWQKLCKKALNINSKNFKKFLYDNFNVYEIKSNKPSLFTGYYTPIIKGSLIKTKTYKYPLYKKPENLYSADLGLFYPELKGKKIIALVDFKNKKIKPFYKRKDIFKLKNQLKPLVWLQSPVDVFFIHIQGSAYIKLDNNKILHASYAGNNGHKYKAIGNSLIKNGWLSSDNISMQSIHKWLKDNPKLQESIFNTNERYIFFKKGDGKVKGSLGVELSSEKSLAIDPKYIPLGIPVYLNTTINHNNKPFNKIMYTEDVGAAIKGGLRGDIFFGKGYNAEVLAGSQKKSGNLYVFIPK